MNIKKLRALRWVKRFNFHQTNNPISVAEHSFFTGLIAHELAILFWGSETYRVVVFAMMHDGGEAIIGDIPYLIRKRLDLTALKSPVKYELQISMLMSTEERAIIQLADVLELKLYLEEERRSGNSGLFRIEQTTMYRIGILLDELIDLNLDEGRSDDIRSFVIKLVEAVPPLEEIDKLTHEGEI